MKQNKIISLMTQWQQADPKLYKTNIRHLCRLRGITYNQIMPSLNVNYETARSYYNVAHRSRIDFLTALKLAKLLGVDVKLFLEDHVKVEKIYNNCIDYTTGKSIIKV